MIKSNINMYVNQLDQKTQEKILDQVSLFLHQSEGLSAELQKKHLEKARSSRLSDLSEIVDYEDIDF